jgi:hypothetical protein
MRAVDQSVGDDTDDEASRSIRPCTSRNCAVITVRPSHLVRGPVLVGVGLLPDFRPQRLASCELPRLTRE